ncbi:hypothetical protein L1887_56489 [Cichorium endivia]|nr:hypothetical protein L1887_56489 [Cichorium endivia]
MAVWARTTWDDRRPRVPTSWLSGGRSKDCWIANASIAAPSDERGNSTLSGHFDSHDKRAQALSSEFRLQHSATASCTAAPTQTKVRPLRPERARPPCESEHPPAAACTNECGFDLEVCRCAVDSLRRIFGAVTEGSAVLDPSAFGIRFVYPTPDQRSRIVFDPGSP